MTGLIQMSEYRRVVERCERLEEQLRYERELRCQSDSLATQFRVAFPCLRRLGPAIIATMFEASRYATRKELWSLLSPDTQEKTIDVHISLIRTALKKAGAPPDAIVTYWGLGYGLSPEGRRWLSERIYGPSQQQGAGR